MCTQYTICVLRRIAPIIGTSTGGTGTGTGTVRLHMHVQSYRTVIVIKTYCTGTVVLGLRYSVATAVSAQQLLAGIAASLHHSIALLRHAAGQGSVSTAVIQHMRGEQLSAASEG
eukprot:COSAG01_NODE_1516_length_10050_cov_7.042910_6_plen_115_part_00